MLHRSRVRMRGPLAPHQDVIWTDLLSRGYSPLSAKSLLRVAAMQLREAQVDLSTIALWLGHESIETTQIYLDADLASREAAVARLAPIENGYRRFRATDDLLAFLNGL